MTKLNQCEQASREPKISYVRERWTTWRSTRLETLGRITNYLFVLNSGALLAALTYVAAKDANDGIQASIRLFAFGTFCSAVHAALDYYLTEMSFSSFRKDVASLYEFELDWEDFVKRESQRPPFDWLLHMFGWLGGIAFFVGLVLGLQQIPSS